MRRRPLGSPTSWLFVLSLLANTALALPGARYWGALVLLWILPGLAYAALFRRPPERPSLEDATIGLALGVGTVALLTLLLHYLPGALSSTVHLVAVDVLLVALLGAGIRRRQAFATLESACPPWSTLVLLLVLTGVLRLVHLGYSEFQGDEATVMMRAASSLEGDGAQLFYHQKGPLEVLLPMATWSLSGTINEWQARLPFALVAILGVLSVYLLGRRWFGERAGSVAAALLAVNGYFVGFGRIVQYQSLVLAMTGLGLLALWRWRAEEGPRWLVVGAALLAFGLLGHYDAALVLPAALYVVGGRIWRLGKASARLPWADVAVAAALAMAVLVLFYVPFFLHPNFGKTLGYLGGARLGAGRLLYNNLLSALPLATFYNSIYYLIAVAAGLIAAAFAPFRRWTLLIPAGSFLVALILPGPWLGPVLGVLLAAVILASNSTSARAAWLWFGVPFLFTFFLIWDPRTHVLNAFPGGVLLVGLLVDRIVSRIEPRGRPLLVGSLIAGLVFLAGYPYLMFVRNDPEIKRTWPDHRPRLYWRPDLKVPREGYFGFPYRAGWKVPGVLTQRGQMAGVYATNEEQPITEWYMRGAERTYCGAPDWYLLAENVQDEVPISSSELHENQERWGTVEGDGQASLRIYRRGPVHDSPATYDVRAYAAEFDAQTTPYRVLSSGPSDYVPTDYSLGDTIDLVGYRVDASEAHPGGSVQLVLYWRTKAPLVVNYQVFTHLYDGTLWGQHDGAPACAMRPTTSWEPGRLVRDEHRIAIAAATPAREIPLLVGLYELRTGARLTVKHPDGSPAEKAVPLTTVQVRPEETR